MKASPEAWHPADGDKNQDRGGQLPVESKLKPQPHQREVCGEKDHGCLDSSEELFLEQRWNKERGR